MVASRVDNMNKQVYNHFNQVKEAIQGVEAIDYFFAKEMLTALATEKVTDKVVELNDLRPVALTSVPMKCAKRIILKKKIIKNNNNKN